MAIFAKVQWLLGALQGLLGLLLAFCVALPAGFDASPALADVLVRLKDGRTITVPVEPDEVKTIEFIRGKRPQKATVPTLPPGPQVLKVGRGELFALPSEAAKAARDGDTVEIAAAVYEGDVAQWRQNNLIIKGVGGRPHLKAAGRAVGGKAIWVIRGDNVRIENLEFSGAAVADHNGAAIRGEGNGLTLDSVLVHDNEMGVMVGTFPASDIVITRSEFYDNYVRGRTKPIGHNIYIGAVRSFLLTNSKVHGGQIGHNVKSRAKKTVISNNEIYDGPSGRASYEIDLPAGGNATIQNNRIEQGANPENTGLVSYGAERTPYNDNRLLIVGNTFRNLYRTGVFVQNHMNIDAILKNNTFSGAGKILRGRGIVEDK